MPFTLKLQDKAGSDLLDVSSYLQLGESGGMDPSPTFEEPSFLDAPLAEGQPLITVNERNREMVFPIWMTAATKDTFHALVTTLGKAAANTKRVYIKDDGATNETYYDVTWARFEPSYKYLHARKKYLAGTLRIYSAPPFGHTGSARALSTGIGSLAVGAGVAYATIPAGSVAGDVAALIQAKITVGASGNQEAPRADGRVVGWAALPTGYVSLIPAASMYGLNSTASLIGVIGAPGSQAIGPRSTAGGATSPLVARFALSASPYAGDNRVFAYVRPGRPMPLAISAQDENGAPIGPTALSRGVHGWHLVDLGVARVPTAGATVPFTVQWALPPVSQNDSAMNLYTTNDKHSGYLAGLLVFPEDKLRVHVDPVQPVGGRWFVGTAVASTVAHFVPDDFGNSYSVYTGGTMVLSPTLGLRNTVNGSSPFSLKLALPEGYENIRHRVMANGPSLPAGGQYSLIVGGRGDYGYDPFIGAQFTPTGPSGPQLFLIYCQDGILSGFTSQATLALEPGAWTEGASHGYLIDVVKQGDTAYANLRQFNKTNIQFFNAAGGSVIADTVASIGFTNVGLRGWRANTLQLYSDGPGNGNFFGHFVDVLSQRPVPSDAYIFDSGAENGMSYRVSGNTGSPPLLMEPYMRGGPQTIDPDTARIAAFAVGLDSVRATNPISVEVKVRERFRFMR